MLTKYGYDGVKTPIIRGSGLKALQATSKDDEWAQKVLQLVTTMDEYIPEPVRDLDKPFLMPIEDIFSIEGRGTVVTGRVERGRGKVNDEVEIVGLRPSAKTVITGIESQRRLMKRWRVMRRRIARGIKKEDVERDRVIVKRFSNTSYRI